MRLLFTLLLLSGQVSYCQPAKIILWMTPLESAGDDGSETGDINSEIDSFNARWSNVEVLNTHPPLRDTLPIRSAELSTANWLWVKNQTQTLDAIERFAKYQRTTVAVRFFTWGELFEELRGLERLPPTERPDLVQVGTTWEHYFIQSGLILKQLYPFVRDVRLIYYWKRFPNGPASQTDVVLDGTSWESVLTSLKTASKGSLVFPIGTTSNLLHDYVPLIWSGGGPLVRAHVYGSTLDLTSREATTVPLLLAESACGEVPCSSRINLPGPVTVLPRHLLSFVDASHEELTRLFETGHYLAIIEPVTFLRRWHESFPKFVKGSRIDFWDYADVAIPPVSFKGGSSLAIISETRHQQEATDLARFLTKDPDFTQILATDGHLPYSPSATPDTSLALATAIGAGATGDSAAKVSLVVQSALNTAREYPREMLTWGAEFESRSTLEAVQQVWRRMGDETPNEPAIRRALSSAEQEINGRINPVYRYWLLLSASWLFSVAAMVLVTSLIWVNRDGSTGARLKSALKCWWQAIAGPVAALGALVGLLIALFFPGFFPALAANISLVVAGALFIVCLLRN